MSNERNWREAKPKWVVDAAEAELNDILHDVALSWPKDAKPVPVFVFGEYDMKKGGKIEEGVYYIAAFDYVLKAEFTFASEKGSYRFEGHTLQIDGNKTDIVHRGEYFRTEREAWLSILWRQCNKKAGELREFHDKVRSLK